MRFSIIIPAYGRPEALRRCLLGLAALEYPRDEFEVLVVDDGSPEPLEAITCAFRDRMNVTYIRQENAGPASARNRGAQCARGEFLAFTDDDCVPRPDWLLLLQSEVIRSPEALLGGTTRNGCLGNAFSEANQILLDSVVSWFQEQGSQLQFLPSNNIAMASAAFREVAGFDTSISLAAGEDREFSARWLASGRPMVKAAAACVDHYHSQNLISFLKMHFRYGKGAAGLHYRRQTSPLLFAKRGLYVALIQAAWRVPGTLSRLQMTVLLALSQIAATLGYVAAKSNPATMNGAVGRG
jgi:glycosyltransferase involved in cell wall biosynthesis